MQKVSISNFLTAKNKRLIEIFAKCFENCFDIKTMAKS